MKTISLMTLLTIAFAGHAQSPKPDPADALKAISEQLKSFSVSQHNLAEMRDGFFGKKSIDDMETAHVDDVLSATKEFRKELELPFFVGKLVAEMRLAEDADTVRRTFYMTAQRAVMITDADIKDVDRYLTAMHDAAARTQVVKVRDAMISIRDILQSVPKND